MNKQEAENLEIDLLLDCVLKRYGYDFRHYARAYVKRRLCNKVNVYGLQHISELIPSVLHNRQIFDELLQELSITVTEMFRDPHFYSAFRQQVVPVLKTYPFIKIWHAGCATGEEVYSMAILLKEEGLLARSQIYATDINNHSLEVAQAGIYSLEKIRQYTDNYNKSDSKASFSDYYFPKYNSAKMLKELREHVTFSNHNLVTDGVFGEMNVVICRNVLIYFNQELQNKVFSLFYDSLCHGGFLCLGTKESTRCSTFVDQFKTVALRESIYKKLILTKEKAA